MSKLSQLGGESKVYKIGDIDLEIKPRTLADVDLVFDLSDEKKRGVAMKELIRRTLKDAVPEATEDEVNRVAFRYFKELSEAIVETNGLNK